MKIKFCLVCKNYFNQEEKQIDELERFRIVKSIGLSRIKVVYCLCNKCTKRQKEKQWKKSGKKNRHHLKPRSRGGIEEECNLLIMDTSRHNAWHFLFGNKTLDEIIDLLKRMRQFKRRRS